LAPSWSSDGASVLASSNSTGNWEIWRVPVAGGAPTRLTQRGGLRAQETPDGSKIYFTKANEAGLWEQTLSTQAERVVVPSIAAGDWTNWMIAKGSAFYVRSDSAGRGQQVVRRDLASGASEVLVTGVRIPVGTGGVAVSDDGLAVIFGQPRRREGDLYWISRRP
jgi:dipeptidyl aminopeptidase/acylaminoacyl peptidase